jgi:hypothetical protein
MHALPRGASDEQVLNAVVEWVRLLAADDFEGAESFLYPHPFPSHRFTPGELRTWISHYGAWDSDASTIAAGRTMRVTSPDAATGDHPSRTAEVTRFDEGKNVVGLAEFDLPLNGSWSDLTAIFEIHEHAGNWTLVLDQVRVM